MTDEKRKPGRPLGSKNRETKTKKAKQKAFLELLPRKAFNVSATANAIGICRKTVYQWQYDDPAFKERFDEALETQIDFVESKAMEQIDQGNTGMIIFFLKTRGKHRGYFEKHQEEVTAQVKTQPTIDLSNASDEELKVLEKFFPEMK